MKKDDKNIIQIIVAVILMWLFFKKDCPLKKESQPQPMARKQEPIMKQENQTCDIDPELYQRMTDDEFNPVY